jgi:DNA-binding NarL/FixJ family response regulator
MIEPVRRQSISVIVADDHPVVLHGVVAVLKADSTMRVVATCSDGVAAITAIRRLQPQVAVLDMTMPDRSGLDVLSSVADEATKVVFLTAAATDGEILTAIARGATGIVFKDQAADELVECIKEVAAGRHWLPSSVINAALEGENSRRMMGMKIAESLTVRERQVMLCVSEGLSNKLVGRRLNLSEGTVKLHLHSIYKKIGVANRTALTTVAIDYRDQLISNPASDSSD